jgi:glycosyltransferase involved in cell wall biosynthesis
MHFIVPGAKGQKLLMHGSKLSSTIKSRKDKSSQTNQSGLLVRPHVALLPWGHTFEDFLDGLGVSFEQFCLEMSGGWLFGYVQALQLTGFQVTIFCFSSQARVVASMRHQPTGTEICLIPANRAYRWMRWYFTDPYAWETDKMFAGRKLPGPAKKLLRHLLPYFATPPWSFRRELSRRGVGMILCQEYEYARFDVVAFLGRVLHLPVFATFQGGNWQSSRLEKITRPLAVRRCAGLVIGSGTEVERVQAKYRVARDKIASLPNPLDLTEWQPMQRAEARERLSLPPTAPIAISHGRIDIFRKGLDLLLDAWVKLRKENAGRDWRLILIGSGDDASQFRTMLAGQSDSSVIWIDRYVRDRPLMRTWLCAADVYVMASRHEGFPVAPLEAMACGLPIIATAVPGIAEIMGDKLPLPGIAVPIADVAALEGALQSLLGDIAVSRDLGLRARERAQDFSLGSVGAQLRDFLLARANSFHNRVAHD